MSAAMWLERINPVLVKEIRQYFNNKFLVGGMMALLAGEFILLMFMYQLYMQMQKNTSGFFNVSTGAVMSSLLLVGVGVIGLLVCGYGSMLRFRSERCNIELDFSYLTNLTPGQIIRGKMYGAFIITVLLYALTLPFLVIAYYLRGVSLVDIGWGALSLLVPIMLYTQIGLFLGGYAKKGVAALYFFLIFFTVPWGTGYFFAILRSTRYGATSQFTAILLGIGIQLLLLSFIYFLTVASVTNSFGNKMRPVRICLALYVPVWAALAASPMLLRMTGGRPVFDRWLLLFCCGTAILSSVAAIIAAYERLEPGVRVLRDCPRNKIRRIGHMLFSSGAYGGILFALLLLVPALAGMVFSGIAAAKYWEIIAGTTQAAMYVIGYAALVVFLRTRFPRIGADKMVLIVYAVLVAVPIVGGLLAGLHNENVFPGLLTTPVCAFEVPEKMCGLVFCAAALLLIARRMGCNIREFWRYQAVAEQSDNAVHVPESCATAKIVEKTTVVKKIRREGRFVRDWFSTDRLNCWTVATLRRNLHNYGFVMCVLGSIFVQATMIITWRPPTLYSMVIPGWMFTLLAINSFGMLLTVAPTFMMTHGGGEMQEPLGRHLSGYSPLNGLTIFTGFLQSLLLFGGALLLLSMPGFIFLLVKLPLQAELLTLLAVCSLLVPLLLGGLINTRLMRMENIIMVCGIAPIMCNDKFPMTAKTGILALFAVYYVLLFFDRCRNAADSESGGRIGIVLLTLAGGIWMVLCIPKMTFFPIQLLTFAAIAAVRSCCVAPEKNWRRLQNMLSGSWREYLRVWWGAPSSPFGTVLIAVVFFLLLNIGNGIGFQDKEIYKWWFFMAASSLLAGSLMMLLRDFGPMLMPQWRSYLGAERFIDFGNLILFLVCPVLLIFYSAVFRGNPLKYIVVFSWALLCIGGVAAVIVLIGNAGMYMRFRRKE